MRFWWLIGATLLALTFSGGSRAQDDMVPYSSADGWEIRRSPDGAFCMGRSEYKKPEYSALFISLGRVGDGSFFSGLMFTNHRWNIAPKTQSGRVGVDGLPSGPVEWDAKLDGKAQTVFWAVHGTAEEIEALFSVLRQGDTVWFDAGMGIERYSLKGSAAALEQLQRCMGVDNPM